MKILGIDPGATTGWCLYCTETKRALAAGDFKGHEWDVPAEIADAADVIAAEKVVPHGPSYPDVVVANYTLGRIVGERRPREVEEIPRRTIRKELSVASYGTVRVTNDATAWAALKMLHGGDGCDRKPRRRKGEIVEEGGPLGRLVSHQRAALAVCVACAIQKKEWQENE